MSSRLALPLTGSTGPGIALPAQTRLDAYEVEALVAQGQFALVYRAVHAQTQQVVAIKEYFPEAIARRHATQRVTPRAPSGSERFEAGRRAFVDEARSLARFDHPSLVRVLGSFEANGTAYRVMRFTPGPTLRAHRLALGRMPAVEDFRRWADGLTGALTMLHHAGCAHGAVSPDNILLRPGERPLLLGFDAVGHALTPARRTGTIQPVNGIAVPPEARGPQAGFAAAAAADLRALAATLRYCIEGAPPAAASLELAWQRAGGPVPIPHDMVRLLQAIDACLCGDPDERPQTVAEFCRRLVKADAPATLRVVAVQAAFDAARSAPEATVGSNAAGEAARQEQADQVTSTEGSAERDPPAGGDRLSCSRFIEGRAAGSGSEAAAAAEADAGLEAAADPAAAPTAEATFGAVTEAPAEVPAGSVTQEEAEGGAGEVLESTVETTFQVPDSVTAGAEVAVEGTSELPAEAVVEAEVAPVVEPQPEAVAAAAAEASESAEAEDKADVDVDVEPDGAPRFAADSPPPLRQRDESTLAPNMGGANAVKTSTDVSGIQPPEGFRSAPSSGLVSTRADAAADRRVRQRRKAAAVAASASVVLVVGILFSVDRQVESPPAPLRAPPPKTHVAETPRADSAEPVPVPAAAPAQVSVAMTTHDANPRPAAVAPAPAEAPVARPVPGQATPAPVVKAPAAPRKVVVAATKTKSPNEACEAQKGFALYRCMQLQCARPAAAGHVDCLSLR